MNQSINDKHFRQLVVNDKRDDDLKIRSDKGKGYTSLIFETFISSSQFKSTRTRLQYSLNLRNLTFYFQNTPSKIFKYFIKSLPIDDVPQRKYIESYGMFEKETILYKDLLSKLGGTGSKLITNIEQPA